MQPIQAMEDLQGSLDHFPGQASPVPSDELPCPNRTQAVAGLGRHLPMSMCWFAFCRFGCQGWTSSDDSGRIDHIGHIDDLSAQIDACEQACGHVERIPRSAVLMSARQPRTSALQRHHAFRRLHRITSLRPGGGHRGRCLSRDSCCAAAHYQPTARNVTVARVHTVC